MALFASSVDWQLTKFAHLKQEDIVPIRSNGRLPNESASAAMIGLSRKLNTPPADSAVPIARAWAAVETCQTRIRIRPVRLEMRAIESVIEFAMMVSYCVVRLIKVICGRHMLAVAYRNQQGSEPAR